MNKQVLERRVEMLNLMVKGAPVTETVKQIAEKYNRTEGGIWNDWNRREKWVPQIVKLDGGTTLEILQGLKEVIRRAWFTHATAQQESVKIAALKIVMEAYARFMDIAQSSGLLKKVPEQLEVKQSVNEQLTITLKQYDSVIRDLMGKDNSNTEQPLDTTHTDTETNEVPPT